MRTITVLQLRLARIKQQNEADKLEVVLSMPEEVIIEWAKFCEYGMGIVQGDGMFIFAMLLAMADD